MLFLSCDADIMSGSLDAVNLTFSFNKRETLGKQ
jgi:hypothetical protein